VSSPQGTPVGCGVVFGVGVLDAVIEGNATATQVPSKPRNAQNSFEASHELSQQTPSRQNVDPHSAQPRSK